MALQPGQIVNRMGKYLYKHLDSATDIEYTPNTCEVSITVLYEIPREIIEQYPEEFSNHSDDINEMDVYINLTTYADKIRMNVIVKDEYEQTLGQRIYKTEKFNNLPAAQDMIIRDVMKILQRKFKHYDFIA